MKKLCAKYPILMGVFIAVVFLFVSSLIGELLSLSGLTGRGYLVSLIGEAILCAFVIGLMALCGRAGAIVKSNVSFFKAFKPLGILYAMLGVSLVTVLFNNWGKPVVPFIDIVIYAGFMLLIGIAEEFLFRGIITGAIADKYAKDEAEVWFSAIISGVIFGFAHILNALSTDFSGVLVQSIMAMFAGAVFGAIYIRTRNLAAMAVYHAVNNFIALYSSGVIAEESFAGIIGSYSLVSYTAIISYSLLLWLTLRKSALQKLLGEDLASSEKSERRLNITVIGVCTATIAAIIYGVIDLYIV